MQSRHEPFSLYIHIPYCISKCPYCDFNSHVVAHIPETRYTEALITELDQYGGQNHWRGRPLQSIFFGGGTPSTFHPQSIGAILRAVRADFPMSADCEITLEANPGTVDARNFSGYRACGVNRISLGVQSFQDRLLKLLGRVHSAEEAARALGMIKSAGFDNFNLDLIYANPGQTTAELEADLDTALGFQPPHLSAYNLTFEEGTPFHRELVSGRLNPLSDEQEIAMAEMLEARLNAAGLVRYEISNYARPGFHSRHNVNYWQCGEYLGVGAGAHSYRRIAAGTSYGLRWCNEKHPARYMSSIESSGSAVVDQDEADLHKAAGEFMFSGLRLIDGISLGAFAARFGENPVELYPRIPGWIEEGLMEADGDRLRLTARGLMVANSIFVHFV